MSLCYYVNYRNKSINESVLLCKLQKQVYKCLLCKLQKQVNDNYVNVQKQVYK